MAEPDQKEKPRIGVFVCHCGKNIGGVVDPAAIVKYATTLPDVVFAIDNLYTCAEPGQEEIRKGVKEHNLNRVVVAACSPKLHEPTFRRTMTEAGLNKYLFEMANIREHCSWVHMEKKEKATEKAMDLVRMGVAKARLLQPLDDMTVPVKKEALVLGGGIAGCQAALDLADLGFKVNLVEKELSIGGIMAQLDKTLPTMDCSICILGPKLVDVGKHENINLITNADLKSVDGFIGNFMVKVEVKPRYVDMTKCNGCGECIDICPVILPNQYDMQLKPRKAIYCSFAQAVPLIYAIDKDKCIECGMCMDACDLNAINFNQEPQEIDLNVGTIIVATGAAPFDATRKEEYGYGKLENVITSMEFERIICASGPTGGDLLRRGGKPAKKVGFIQCVGSRDEKCGNKYCSSYCCLATIKQAMLIKEHDPEAEIYIFYTDIRAFGKGYEELYARGREEGMIFIRGRPSSIKENPKNKNPIIVVENTLTNELMEVEVDLAVLAIGLQPTEGARNVAQMLHVPIGADGFFIESHPKLKPVDTPVDGIYICGTSAQPRDIKDSVTTGSAAAARASIPMVAGKFSVEGITSVLAHPEKCTACAICITRCSYGAIQVKEKGKTPAIIIEALCKGCGTCIADCPFKALDQRHFTDEQIFAQIDAALEENPEDKIISFNCNWCSYAGSDLAGVSRFQYPTNVRIIRVMCSGRVSKEMIKRAFDKGAGMVLVAPCHPNDCHYISGNVHAKNRIDQLYKVLPSKGIDPRRLRLEYVSAAEGLVYQKLIKEMTEQLEEFKKQGIIKAPVKGG